MAQGIVDILEVVQIDEQHGQAGIVAGRMQNALSQAVVEQDPVR